MPPFGQMSVSNRKKRILYVTPFDEPLSGADESLLLVIAHLDRAKFEPMVLLPPDSHYRSRYERAGAIVWPWPMSRMRRSYSPQFWMRFVADLRRELRELPPFLAREQIDLVHINMHVSLGPLLAAERAGIPRVVHYRAKTNDRPGPFFDLFLPWLHRRSTRIVCISQAVARHFSQRGLSDRTIVLHNPVDLARFLAPAKNDFFGRFPRLRGKKIVLFVGRIDPQKRIHILIEALALLARGQIDIGGAILGDVASHPDHQRYFSSLRDQTAALKSVPIEWIPATPDVPAAMQSADLFAFPAVNEGFGRVLVEAMASRLPIVGVRSGATPELLGEDRFGQVVAPEDPVALSAAILHGLSDPKWRDAAARAMKHAEENFSVERHVSRLEEMYTELVS